MVIVGGGMVGATLACALGDSPLRVLVLEPQPFSSDWQGFDLRVSAITRASQRVFEALGAWEGMQARRVQPYRSMEVWEGGGQIRFDSAEIGEPDLGHIIENRVILAALLERLAGFDNIELRTPARARSLQLGPERANLRLEDGTRLEARLVVGADGSASWVRRQAGIDTLGWKYDQHAVVATVRTARHHEETAFQRFLPEGSLAFLPLSEGVSSIVWSVRPGAAEALLGLDEAAFLAELGQAFGDRLGAMQSCAGRAAFPLGLQHADRYVLPRLALVGNAAHTIHPLAGQGLNLGVMDAAALAEVIAAQMADCGALRGLRRYERWRKGENLGMALAMDGFKQLFGARRPPLPWLRRTGLNLTNAAGPLKRTLIRRAMGLEGDLPVLARAPVNRSG